MATQPSLLFTHRTQPKPSPSFDAGAAEREKGEERRGEESSLPENLPPSPIPKGWNYPDPVPYPLFHSLSLSLPPHQPFPPVFLYPARLHSHLEQRGFAFNTGGGGGRILKNWQGYPLIVCPWRGWGGYSGFYIPGAGSGWLPTWPSLKLGFGWNASFYSRR